MVLSIAEYAQRRL